MPSHRQGFGQRWCLVLCVLAAWDGQRLFVVGTASGCSATLAGARQDRRVLHSPEPVILWTNRATVCPLCWLISLLQVPVWSQVAQPALLFLSPFQACNISFRDDGYGCWVWRLNTFNRWLTRFRLVLCFGPPG